MTGYEPAVASRPAMPEQYSEDRSIGEVMGDLTRDLSTLLRQEVTLAKAELRESSAQATKAGGLLAGAAIGAVIALVFLSIALWWALAMLIGFGWSALVVAVMWIILAVALSSSGRKEMARVRGLPKTQETVSKIPNALKGNEEENR